MRKTTSSIKEDLMQLNDEKPSFRDLLKNRSYMLLFGGQLSFFIANILIAMTFSYLIYDITKNAALMGLMNIVGILPSILIISFAGVIVDRYDERKIFLISLALRCIVFLGFLLVFIFKDSLIIESVILIVQQNGNSVVIHNLNYIHFIWPMYSLYFLSSILGTFMILAVNAYSKLIIEKKNLLIANSFNQTVIQLSSVIGPILVGLLITFSYLYSFLIGLIIAGISTIIGVFLFYYGKKPPVIEIEKQENFKENVKQVFKDFKVGYVVTRSEPKLMFALVVYVVFNVATGTINGLYTVVTQGEMNLNPTWIGALQAVMAGVAILTSLIILKIGKINKKLVLILVVVFIEAIGLFLFAFNRNPWILICLTTIPFGFVNGAANIPTQTLRQELVPHEQQGRVFSIAALFCSTGSLVGNIVVASISNYVQPVYILVVGGSLCLIVTIIGFILYKTKSIFNCSDYQENIITREETYGIGSVKSPSVSLDTNIDLNLEKTPMVSQEENPSIDYLI